jgi:hypothetical protein
LAAHANRDAVIQDRLAGLDDPRSPFRVARVKALFGSAFAVFDHRQCIMTNSADGAKVIGILIGSVGVGNVMYVFR